MVFGAADSSSGSPVAVDRADPITGKRDIWLIDDLASGIPNRFTADAGDAANPMWSPDGKTILFSSTRDGTHQLYRKDSSGNGTEELLKDIHIGFGLGDWSSDGRYVLFALSDEKRAAGYDLQLIPMTGAEPPSWFLQTPFNEAQARISPNGKWIVYVSDESGKQEVYVQTFPKPGNPSREVSAHDWGG